MELSEAKELLKEMKENAMYLRLYHDEKAQLKVEAIDTVLKALDNSISKDEIRKKIEEINSVDYENVKTIKNDYDEWFWKTTGAEHALKQLLGEE